MAPQHPKKPTAIIRAPAPTSTYSPVGRGQRRCWRSRSIALSQHQCCQPGLCHHHPRHPAWREPSIVNRIKVNPWGICFLLSPWNTCTRILRGRGYYNRQGTETACAYRGEASRSGSHSEHLSIPQLVLLVTSKCLLSAWHCTFQPPLPLWSEGQCHSYKLVRLIPRVVRSQCQSWDKNPRLPRSLWSLVALWNK